MPDTQERRGREGGRWINERPTSEEFATWFTDSMSIDPKLDVKDYIGGVVLIPAVDNKAKQVVGFREGGPLIEERPELSYVPYAKVETRIAYFWDLLEAHEDEWVGVVESETLDRPPADNEALGQLLDIVGNNPSLSETIVDKLLAACRPTGLAQLVQQLPDGFSITSIPVGTGYTHFVCCTLKVAIYRRADWEKDPASAVPVRQGRGTKQVPLTGSYNQRVWADQSSLMKAETGALGRALGFAGIFVIPGSGVATAEDMIEANSQAAAQPSPVAEPGDPSGPSAPAEPAVRTGAEQAQDDETQLRAKASRLYHALPKDRATEFGQWMHSRRLNSFADAKGAMLKGVVKKLEKMAEDQEIPPKEDASDVPGETSPEPSGPPAPSEQ